MKTDLELRQDVERQLAWDPKVDATKIAVTAKNGVVTLTGHVQSFLEKWEADKVVKGVLGVTGIAEDLEVTLGGATSDTDLTQRVVNSLKWNVSVPSDIKPTVRDGWVTLEGKVKWYHEKSAAQGTVLHLQGVKGVTNFITIDNPVEPQDVSNKITEALARNARIDRPDLHQRANEVVRLLAGAALRVDRRPAGVPALAGRQPGIASDVVRLLASLGDAAANHLLNLLRVNAGPFHEPLLDARE